MSRKEFDVFNWTLLEGLWHYEWGHINANPALLAGVPIAAALRRVLNTSNPNIRNVILGIPTHATETASAVTGAIAGRAPQMTAPDAESNAKQRALAEALAAKAAMASQAAGLAAQIPVHAPANQSAIQQALIQALAQRAK